MRGLMQEHPLLISSLIEFAALYHADTEIVSRRVEGDIHRYRYAEAAARARKVARALDALAVAPHARVATLAWNGYRHFELYYGVSGSQRIIHTINPRLHPEQMAWIVNHAEDEVLCFDLTFVPLIKAIAAKCPTVKHWVALCEASMLPKDEGLPPLLSYESLIAEQSDRYRWPIFDENTAAGLCYTSGTTGHPKGVLYSHRSTLLHAMASASPAVMGCTATDVVLPVVPMFHVNAWGLPYVCPMMGCKLVFPGPALDGRSIYELFEAEKVTFSAGVPTVWQMLLAYLEQHGLKLSSLKRVVVGGSACPPAMFDTFREKHGVSVDHAWGMTEMSPLGTYGTLKGKHLALPREQQRAILLKQGRAVFGVDMKIVDDLGRELPRDGKTFGNLMVRGPWVVREYFKGEGGPILDEEGYFHTGDVATLDSDGYMQITDRSKDVIKSGGEWISSIDIENIAMAHPAVAMAACIGLPHPKWDERPVLVVVKKPGVEVSKEELLAFYVGKVAKWQIPDDVFFVESIPLGATGKMQKSKLREQFASYRFAN
ncbi:MAG: 3-(methylthio)propionyl-CoA ligase [Casimicrobiaceae bacterium]|nr:3-(methylthio)propionyl-CoA ligase [Casimicrobiaceae bacterium]MCX8098178.1 3-(methylthio)propionyl-CoA ligase [Casimicrobiaceae bacterium]MDW8312774.1 3-(methylthio)propionyl-CoA ligase [Burkholderiales bacterium]